MDMATTGKKTQQEHRLSMEELPLDHPLYKTGFVVGGKILKLSRKDNHEQGSKDKPADKKE